LARIELAPEIAEDFDRILAHLRNHEVEDPIERVQQLVQGFSVLEFNPLIGRPTQNELRELVIGRRSRGYVALYRYVAEIDTVFVLAVRGQKEAGYVR
jgi:toxin ParE1/3/4